MKSENERRETLSQRTKGERDVRTKEERERREVREPTRRTDIAVVAGKVAEEDETAVGGDVGRMQGRGGVAMETDRVSQ